MSNYNSMRDVLHWFSTKSTLNLCQAKLSEDLMENLAKSCILVPGPYETQIWYQTEGEGLYYIDHTKTVTSLVCAYSKIFGCSSSSLKRKNKNGQQQDCKAVLSFAEKSQHIQHSHPSISKEQALQLCFSWAVELLSCTVGDSSWLALGVGYLSSLWPKGSLLNQGQASQVESALLMSQRRNAEGKKRFLDMFSVKNFVLFSQAVQQSSVFKNALWADQIQWESSTRMVYDLVKGALEWQPPLSTQYGQFLVPHSSVRDKRANIGFEDASSSDKESISLRFDGQHETNRRADHFTNKFNEASISGSPAALSKPGNKTTSVPKEALPEVLRLTPESEEPPPKKRTMSLNEIEVDNSVNENLTPCRLYRKAGRRARSRLRTTSEPRSFTSKRTKKRAPRNHAPRDVSPLPQGSLHGVPDVMAPIVVLHRLPSSSLEKLQKQNGAILVNEIEEEPIGK